MLDYLILLAKWYRKSLKVVLLYQTLTLNFIDYVMLNIKNTKKRVQVRKK
jgi:hypothetical protein